MSQVLQTSQPSTVPHALTGKLLGPPCATTILTAAAALLCIGVVMVLSAQSWRSAVSPTSQVALFSQQTQRQVAFAGLALVAMLVAARFDYRWLARVRLLSRPLTTVFLLISICLLVMVLFPGLGLQRNFARRWLPLGPASLGITFQPSELAKLALVIWLAERFGTGRADVRDFRRGLLPAVVALGAIVALIGLEDFGTAVLIGVVALLLLTASGLRWRYLCGLLAVGAAGFTYLLVSKPYRIERLVAFTEIWEDPTGAGYHAVQSLLAIASGSWAGQGLGAGLQKFGYLPEVRNDFIFALICEEMGFVGAAAVIGLFAIIIWQATAIVAAARDNLARLTALGIALLVGMQAAMNIAVVTVMVPTKGIALPLVSAGGTSLIVTAAAVGLLANIAKGTPADPTDTPIPTT